MKLTVNDLMSERVISAQPHHTVGHVRTLMDNNHINAIPVLSTDNEPVGIFTSTDLVEQPNEQSPVSAYMTTKVYTVPRYEGVHVAARIMRNHHIHHLVVTHEKEVVGVLSAFDLLALVEEHRFVMKPRGTESKRKGSKRA